MEITKLKKNQVFVFGSNLNGTHAGGAALTAFKKFGAEMGIGEGMTGRSYAFPTLDKNMKKVSQAAFKCSIKKLYQTCKENPDKEFLLTKVGCGIAGFSENEVRGLFKNPPHNLVLPEDWEEKPVRTLYKFLREGLKSEHGNHVWKVGRWYTEPKVSICNSGFHASNTPREAFSYVQGEILAVAEARGERIEQEDKSVWSDMRIVKAYKWQKKDSVAFSIYAAELVLENLEKVYPNDRRPREAIEAAKKWLADPTEENASAARSAADSAADSARSAYSAARSAADSARSAYSAAYSAYSAARSAYSAAYSAADSAADSARSAADSAADSARSAYSAAYSAADSAAFRALTKKLDTWFLDRISQLEEIV